MSAMWAELLVRGAGSLDSRAHADALDGLGVSRGTSVETFNLSLTATLLGSRLEAALPLLVDMVRRPRMESSSVEPARDLCLQAVESLKDDPGERVMVVLRDRHAPEPINRSSLGTEEGLESIEAEELLPAWHARARPVGSVLALAGDVDAGEAARWLDGLLKGWEGGAAGVSWSGSGPRGYHHEVEETNQVHIGVAYDAPAEPEAGCWPERLATAVLSGGMSGRLFTEVREKRGLCYSVSASYGTDATFGRTAAYAGTTPERAQQTLDVLMGELQRIGTAGGKVEAGEFSRAKVGMKSRLVMSGESTSARASALARDWHKLGRARSLEELTAQVDGVTLERVNEHLASRGLGRVTVCTIGPEALVMPGA